KVHHQCIGVHHFVSGVLHVKQMTGWEHHNIQCTIVAMIAGAMPSKVIQCIRTLINFIYQAQHPVYTESSIQSMESSLAEFHVTKDAIIATGAHQGKKMVKEDFNIPKLELLLGFVNTVRNSSGLLQYTADVSEHFLITHCKTPFICTSQQRDFAQQIIQLLDHEEHMRILNLYLLLWQYNEPIMNTTSDEASFLDTLDPTVAWVSRVAPKEQHRFNTSCPICNYFVDSFISDSAEVALSVTVAPS
ncbi:hypothetical protein HD554DRAFT_1983514, partial [Boletus coccyginus]